jgi:hypothetical protein
MLWGPVAVILATFAVTSTRGSAEGLPAVRSEKTELTAYPDFENACVGVINGYAHRPDTGSPAKPKLGHYIGNCIDNRSPLVLGVTQENPRNNHDGAANNARDMSSYVADFDYDADFGRWLNLELLSDESGPILSMELNDLDFNTTNITGWPLQFGHMFMGVTDSSVATAVDKPVYVEFDVRVKTRPTPSRSKAGYSGRRVVLGALVKWQEQAPRSNISHFLEVDILQSRGYSESYREPDRPLCHDAPYDRCFYSTGSYAEGREVGYQRMLGGRGVIDNDEHWTHIRIPLADLIYRLRWVAPPSGWDEARLSALYFGIESQGAVRTRAEFRRYHVYTSPQFKRDPQEPSH